MSECKMTIIINNQIQLESSLKEFICDTPKDETVLNIHFYLEGKASYYPLKGSFNVTYNKPTVCSEDTICSDDLLVNSYN